jgi:hypothetical protein
MRSTSSAGDYRRSSVDGGSRNGRRRWGLSGLQPWPDRPTRGARPQDRSLAAAGAAGASGRPAGGASFCYRQTCWPLTTAHLLEGSCGRGGGRWGTLVTTGGRGGLGAGGAGRTGSVGGAGA